jgi:hypothetical protein
MDDLEKALEGCTLEDIGLLLVHVALHDINERYADQPALAEQKSRAFYDHLIEQLVTPIPSTATKTNIRRLAGRLAQGQPPWARSELEQALVGQFKSGLPQKPAVTPSAQAQARADLIAELRVSPPKMQSLLIAFAQHRSATSSE